MSASLCLMWLAGTLLPLAALWALFRVVLRGERCFGYNRTLLLLVPLVAAAWPLLPHPALLGLQLGAPASGALGPAVLLPTLRAASVGAASGWPAGAWLNALAGLYAVGVVLGLARLIYRYGQLQWATGRLPRKQHPGYVLAYTGGQLPTSSFGATILWDETAVLTPAEAAAVLAHELAHVRQGHSYDVLWLELWRIVLWPNPFVHLLLPALRLTHELLADRAALAGPARADVAAQAAYPALLARLAAQQVLGTHFSSLLQPFTFSFTLTRIAMLQSKNPVRRWKQWLVLPVLGGLFLAACQTEPLEKLAPPPPPPVLLPADQANRPQKVYTYVEQMPQLPGAAGVGPIVKQIQDKLVYPTGAHQQGMVFASFTVNADGGVSDTKIVKGLAPANDEAVLAAIRQLPRFVPGKQSGQAVAVSFTVPVKFSDQP